MDVEAWEAWDAAATLALGRIAIRIGHQCMDFAPIGLPYTCTKRRGHRGGHAAHIPELRSDGRVVLRCAVKWRRGR